ncbi:MAG TPA: GntR family transcriptional regulator [Phycisphaerae bacterium]|nr:GntR family transcriptional regulator [Phycisphaerae bacterium]
MPRTRAIGERAQRERAYELLRRALMLQQIPAGQRLRETEWAERLNVNRTALREACGRLCAEGLIADGPKRGYFVAQLSSEELEDALEVRLLLEAGTIERICRLGLNKPRNLQPLQKACEELEWLLRNGYRNEVAESDRRFHEALVALAANARLARLYRCIPPGSWFAIGRGQECETAGRMMLREHRDILTAIQRGRAAEAQGLLRGHVVSPGEPCENGVGAA